MKKISLVLALVTVLLCVFTACGEEKSGGITIETSAGDSVASTQIISGLMNESFTVPVEITKIVSVSPAASMILDALGASAKLVAVDAVSAGYLSAAPAQTDAASAAALHPEVIFVDEADADKIGDTDVPVFVIPTAESSDAIKKLIRLCGKVSGVASEDLITNFTNTMNAAQMGSSAYSSKFTAYVDLGGKTVGSGTYVTEMLYAAGLENICTAEGFTTMTEDEIIAANPEFIFTIGDPAAYTGNASFADVQAVKNGFVFQVNEKDICYASNNISAAVSSMYENVSNTRGDE